MGKVIDINAERWTILFESEDLTVTISTRGSVNFFTPKLGGTTLVMKDMMHLLSLLSEAYGAETVSGKDE